MNEDFPKSEKLCGATNIDNLYQKGRKFVVWPMRITYMESEDTHSQVLIWAPKSLFHRAVDRNRLRRLMREAYRLNKHILGDVDKTYQLAFNYIDKQKHDFQLINRAMCKALKRLATANEI
jgi:ribonuclease P protein component